MRVEFMWISTEVESMLVPYMLMKYILTKNKNYASSKPAFDASILDATCDLRIIHHNFLRNWNNSIILISVSYCINSS
ncbi:hypothetical protein [Clostridium beijerinckii]|uniref:hypothetical protein n=1 Tax=Clostridium beijerinckii TaxID=1520 RepID=UPI0004CFA3E8|nr:hypothetical protein [Clostridium beijerinckii]ALB45573.1 hypothetical protein X276_09930 [Clostridium beijerinckii NRRL B-598]